MLDGLMQRVNGNAALVRRGRYVSATMFVGIGEEGYLVRIDQGAVTSVTPAGTLMPDWTFALRAPRDAWEKFLSAAPPPGFTDIFALQRHKLMRIEGNLHPFMANLLYFKDVLATLRKKEAA